MSRKDRVPVSTVRTGCIPFNKKQKAAEGYKVGENPVKENGYFVVSFEDALEKLRSMNNPGWRDYGSGNSQSAHKSIGWVTKSDASILLAEPDPDRRVGIFKALKDVVI